MAYGLHTQRSDETSNLQATNNTIEALPGDVPGIALHAQYRSEISGTGSLRVQLEHRALPYERLWTPSIGYFNNPGEYTYTAVYKQDGPIKLRDETGIKNDAFKITDRRSNNGGYEGLEVEVATQGRRFFITQSGGRMLETGDLAEVRNNPSAAVEKFEIRDLETGKTVVISGQALGLQNIKGGLRMTIGGQPLSTAFDKAAA